MREHEYETEIDTRLEGKLGFDRVRTFVADRCSTEYAVTRVTEERFSNDPKVIRERLALTDEMRLIVMFEENFPTNGTSSSRWKRQATQSTSFRWASCAPWSRPCAS